MLNNQNSNNMTEAEIAMIQLKREEEELSIIITARTGLGKTNYSTKLDPMKQVTREEFYRLLRETGRNYNLDVDGNSTKFKFTDDKSIFGEVIDTMKDGEDVIEYYVNK